MAATASRSTPGGDATDEFSNEFLCIGDEEEAGGMEGAMASPPPGMRR